MTNELSTDKPAKLNLRVGARHSSIWNFKQYEDPAKTIPMNFTGTHKMVLSNDVDGESIQYTIDASNILVMSGNDITVDFTTELNIIPPRTYYFDWRSDDGAGHSTHIAKGLAYFEHTQAKP